MPANGSSRAVSRWVWWMAGCQEWHPSCIWDNAMSSLKAISDRRASSQLCIVQGWLQRFCRSRTRAGVARVGWWAFFCVSNIFTDISPLCWSLVWTNDISDALIKLRSWQPWSWRCYRALVLHLCFGACHLAAVICPMVLPDPVAGAVAPLQPTLLWLCVLAIQVDWEVAKVNSGEGETKKGDCYPSSELRQQCLWHWWDNTPMTVPSASCKSVLSLPGLTVSQPDFDISWAWLYPSHFSILRGTLAQMSAATRNSQKLLCSENVLCPRFILRTKGTAYNSAPDFSEFKLVSTLLSFLTLYTRLLHTNQKPNGRLLKVCQSSNIQQ